MTHDEQLAKRLADPGVDRKFADAHIRRACAEIQATWSEPKRCRAAGEPVDKSVDIRFIDCREMRP